VQKIVETETAMLAVFPITTTPSSCICESNTGGGLEHLNSTAAGFGALALRLKKATAGFTRWFAHEFFNL